ncbi:MAG: SMP-30/gluconolactonase/LRE family protein, partial [Gloeomargaritales cyanobacterium]
MSMDGWSTQGVQIVDSATGTVTQTLEQRAAFIGIAFSPDGRTLYASGGNQDVIYRYDWASGRATLRDSIVLAVKRNPRRSGTRYPAGIAFSPDGARLYVAENLADSLAVVDVASGQVLHRYATGAYPYGVVVGPAGNVFVSAWGGFTVSEFAPDGDGYTVREIRVGRHQSALLLNRAGTRLFVATGSTDRVLVVGTRDRRVIETLLDPPPAGPGEGSTPNALALSPDGTRLYVAEADANAIAVFDLAAGTSGIPTAAGNDLLAGRIPTAWYPSLVAAFHDTLFVATSKGMGTRANPAGPWPILSAAHSKGRNYTLGQLDGSVMLAPVASASGAQLAGFSARVTRANGWDGATGRTGAYPPFKHVIYIIKENRT